MTKLAWALIGGFFAAVLVFSTGLSIGRTQIRQDWDNSKLVETNNALAFQEAFNTYGARVGGELTTLRGQNRILADELKKAVSRVTTVYVPSPGAAPVALPDYRFTRGALCLYGAFDLQAGQGGAASRSDAEARCLEATDALTLSDITPGDLLDADIDNAESCRNDRDTLDRAQALLLKLANGG